MTILQDILAAVGWQTRVTENFRSVSPAGLYGINPATTTGLTFGYLGGEFNGVTVANGTVALTASATNYVVAHRTTGAVTAATNTTNWLNTSTYMQLYQLVAGASTFTISATSDKRQAFGGAGSSGFTGGTLTTALNEAPQVTIASAATVNIGAAAANSVTVSGTTTITAFDSIAPGAKREVVFSGALTLTHNATSLILPTAANITTAAGDVADFVSLGSGNWRCVNYMRASGSALAGAGTGTVTSVDASGGVETVSGSPITATGTIRSAVAPNPQTGTTYTVVTGDRGKLLTFSNASAVAVTLPQATSTFGAGWYVFLKNLGTGTVTITPTTSTIGGAASLALTTGQWAMVVSDGANYNTLFVSSAGGGGGLTNFTEAVNTSAPNTIVPVVSLTATNGATDVDVAFVPKGAGAITAQVANNATSGGNKRGANAVDWQTSRTSVINVASGIGSTLSGGGDNRASGTFSVVGGGNVNLATASYATVAGGYTNTASAQYSFVGGGGSNTASNTSAAVVGGQSNTANQTGAFIGGGSANTASGSNSAVIAGSNSTASGNGSFASGRYATTRALDYAHAHAAARFAAVGDAQSCRFIQMMQTTNATATALSTGGAAPSATTAIVLPDSSVYHFIARIAARNNANGDAATFEIRGAIKRGSGVATTSILGTPTVTTVGADAGASSWTIAAVANTTLGSLEIQATGAASTTIKWVASIWTTEVVG